MRRKYISLLWLPVAVLSVCGPAFGQTRCGPTAEVLAALKAEHQERLRFSGIDSAGSLVSMTVSPSGSWTLLVAPPGPGLSCIIGHGEDGAILSVLRDEGGAA